MPSLPSVSLCLAIVSTAVITWMVARFRSSARTAVAVSEARAALHIEIAALTERTRTAESRLSELGQQLSVAQAAAHDWRTKADESGREVTRLDERAARLLQTEEDLASFRRRDQDARTQLSDLQASAATEIARFSTQAIAQADQIKRLVSERDEARAALGAAETANGELREKSGRVLSELNAKDESIDRLTREHNESKANLREANSSIVDLKSQLADLRARAEKERENVGQQLQILNDAKASLTDQFKNLAGEILEEKSRRFAEQNQASLSSLLEPLRNRLTEFQGKVEQVYVDESKDRSALQEQVRQLLNLNKTLGEDARNLTQALRGSSKTQGHWGELVLERVLENSGLRKDIEYITQQPKVRDDGTRATPDVAINLPEDRWLVVDSKVSLTAYERYVSASDDADRTSALKSHLDSIRAHIKSLSDKRYHALYDGKSLDFVLAFVPVEPAFMLAVTNDEHLFQEAWNRNVLLVSPSTLLFVLRTVAHLWRQEAQSRNAQEIAKRGADLYDKLSAFVTDLQNVGSRLRQAKDAYELAESKLMNGRGNVIRQAEMLRALGVKPTKFLPSNIVEKVEIEAEAVIEAPCVRPATAPN